MNLIAYLVVLISVVLIISYGTALLISRNPVTANKLVAKEFEMIAKFLRWSAKRLLKLIASICSWAEKQL